MTSALLLMGHAYMIVLVFLCQSLVYREVTALFALTAKGKKIEQKDKDPWSKTLNWYFFAVVNYFLYGESIIYYFKVRSCRLVFTVGSNFPSACRVLGRATDRIRHQPPLH